MQLNLPDYETSFNSPVSTDVYCRAGTNCEQPSGQTQLLVQYVMLAVEFTVTDAESRETTISVLVTSQQATVPVLRVDLTLSL